MSVKEIEMIKTRIHPETGKVLRRDVRSQAILLGALAHTVDVPGWYPDDDSDSIHTGADLKASDEAFQDLQAACAEPVGTVRKRSI